MKNIIILIFLFSSTVQTAYAFTWTDLWARKDEQAAVLLARGQAKKAAKLFKNKDWQSVAYYRSGQYERSARQFSQEKTTLAHYNRGNALAHLGDYQQAINAYNAALALNPKDQDAKYNRDLLKKLLKNKKKQKQRKNKNQQAKTKKPDNKKSQQKKTAKNQKNNNKGKNKQPKKMAQNKTEAQRAREQWLRRVPDDPGGLLKQKFLREYRKRQHEKV